MLRKALSTLIKSRQKNQERGELVGLLTLPHRVEKKRHTAKSPSWVLIYSTFTRLCHNNNPKILNDLLQQSFISHS